MSRLAEVVPNCYYEGNQICLEGADEVTLARFKAWYKEYVTKTWLTLPRSKTMEAQESAKWIYVAEGLEKIQIPGGWMYRTFHYDNSTGSWHYSTPTFVPDPPKG